MIPPIDVDAELEALDAALQALSSHRSGERITERVAAVSGWSIAEHLYHVCLSTDLALRNVASLVRRKGRLITQAGGPNALAVQVLTDGTYPRGESEAPRMVRPPDEVDLALLDTELALLAEGIQRTRSIAETIPDAAGRIPHQHLGELRAVEWLRFARLHVLHHLAIVADIAAS